MPWARARASVTAYFAPQFSELRRRVVADGEAAFLASLCRCSPWAAQGGKSNAYFAKVWGWAGVEGRPSPASAAAAPGWRRAAGATRTLQKCGDRLHADL
eukprot:149360-Chlamydomonas_euryale.AAC.1